MNSKKRNASSLIAEPLKTQLIQSLIFWHDIRYYSSTNLKEGIMRRVKLSDWMLLSILMVGSMFSLHPASAVEKENVQYNWHNNNVKAWTPSFCDSSGYFSY